MVPPAHVPSEAEASSDVAEARGRASCAAYHHAPCTLASSRPRATLRLKVGDDWEEGAVFALRDRTGDARMCAPHGGCAFRLCGHEDPRAAGWAIRS